MNPPIHDVVERVPGEGSSVRVWLEDGMEAAAIFSAHWWDDAQAPYIKTARWQETKNPWDGTVSGSEKQRELRLVLQP